MIISIPKEIGAGETRVAATPETVKKMNDWGYDIKIEKDAGRAAGFSDEEYIKAGAQVLSSPQDVYETADIILKIRAPEESESKFLKPGQIIIADFQALACPEKIKEFAKLKTTCFALDLMPRISRAQSMDILSSQSNLAGYKAVLNAVNLLDKAVPMMMTAAGTIAPAKVLVLGAGVAGLQAIATAKRLGAQVFASDVRPGVKEQVESLGGRFLDIEAEAGSETAGGYAKETSEDYKKRQAAAVAEQLKKTDIAITTALIPGRKAPRLITAAMLKDMPAGAVIIDMAAGSGGNVDGSVNGETVKKHGVTIQGNSNLAAELPQSASSLFARNIYNFLTPMYNVERRQIEFNYADELIKATCICRDGQILRKE